jgi:hypothetical protein
MMAGMSDAPTRCPHCSEPLKPAAKFCPKCGRGVVAIDPEAARKQRIARREVILGWIFLTLAAVLIFPVIYGRGGGVRTWLGFSLGVPLAFIAIGCLVGQPATTTTQKDDGPDAR